MPQISKYVRDAVRTQLSVDVTGFNARLALLVASYGIEKWEIDWSPDSVNFLFGRVNPALIEASSVLSYPLTTIDTVRAQHTNRVKFATFSGTIQTLIEVHHSWPQSAVLADFASWLDATEDAMISTVNDQNGIWPRNLEWNGQVAAQRGPIIQAGYGWLQTLSFFCQFTLSV